MCKGNNAGYFGIIWDFQSVMRVFFSEILFIFALTVEPKAVILARRSFQSQELTMSDSKLEVLRQSRTLHPHPDQVRDPLFTSGSPFFDPRDLVQVKYELLRRVRVDGDSVSHATSLFGISSPTFYETPDHVRTLPAAWTSLVPIDPSVVLAAGRAAFRVRDLQTLAQLIQRIDDRKEDPEC